MGYGLVVSARYSHRESNMSEPMFVIGHMTIMVFGGPDSHLGGSSRAQGWAHTGLEGTAVSGRQSSDENGPARPQREW